MTTKLVVLAISLASGWGFSQNPPAREVTLQDLTVPQNSLPDGCRLESIPSKTSDLPPGKAPESGRFGMLPRGMRGAELGLTRAQMPTENPWTGTDRVITAAMRLRMVGAPAVPDGPPLTRREAVRYHLRLADDVEEGYLASYAHEGAALVFVYAVRLVKPATPASTLGARGSSYPRTPGFTIGRLSGAVYGDGGPCYQAVDGYLKSLQR